MTAIHARKACLPSGWADDVRITVAEGVIASIEQGVAPAARDRQTGIVIPGLCNAHSHAFQRALAGHTEQASPGGKDNFWTWRERMYALAGKVGPDALTAIARQAYCEMLAAGFTAVVEFHYLHRSPGGNGANDAMFHAIADAARDSGIRLTYVPVHYERAGFDVAGPTPQQAGFVQPLRDFLDHYERVASDTGTALNVALGVHSLRAVTEESLRQIAARANDAFVPMHLHIAEQQGEVEQCLTATGHRPVQWLLDHCDVGSNWCLVHATHMDDSEIALVARSGAVVVLCPSTEANLGDGLFPLHAFLEQGGRMAIGSDSHITINPFEELRWLEYGQRLASQTRNVVSLRGSHVGAELFQRALEGGAAAAGLASAGLEAYGPADFVVLNDEDPMLAGHSDASRLDALVFSGYPLPVERVMVAGEWRVVDAVHIEREQARAEFAAALAGLGADEV